MSNILSSRTVARLSNALRGSISVAFGSREAEHTDDGIDEKRT